VKSVIKKEIRPHSFAAWMAFMRPKTFWIAAAPVCVGTAFAGALAGTWNLWIFPFLHYLVLVSLLLDRLFLTNWLNGNRNSR